MAPLADVGDTSTEDAPSASLLDASLADTSRLADVPQVRQDPGASRGKTDEEWLQLG
jgi:hypothetical protein